MFVLENTKFELLKAPSPLLLVKEISLPLQIYVSSVLYVPNFTLNLLSVSHLTKHLNCGHIFFLLIVCFRT